MSECFLCSDQNADELYETWKLENGSIDWKGQFDAVCDIHKAEYIKRVKEAVKIIQGLFSEGQPCQP